MSTAPSANVYLSGRTVDDYQRMFSLTGRDLKGRSILDCPAGSSDFALRARMLGAEVVSVDPLFDHDVDDLAWRVRQDRERLVDNIGRSPEMFRPGAADRYRSWAMPQEEFLADYARDRVKGTRHYVAAALPVLPFEDQSFDLALSAFLLFSYHALFDLSWHVQALAEMLRVAHTVQIHPLEEGASRALYSHYRALQDALPGFEFTTKSIDNLCYLHASTTLTIRPRN
ncbi:class I SAM-dependent methyltransferase [Streptomyces sp. NPDC051546]|uniref:class I SAM-dependent methyltransferase n=1 Tax=Streptomyces sp. NPDC051546 TaxID=3365655 RepID=UPI00378BC699